MPITGLQANELVMGIDFRPANGLLYGVTSNNRLILINTATGLAANVGTLAPIGLNGVEFGVTFNPVADRLRVVSDVNQSLRINPLDASSIQDTSLTYVAGDPGAGVDPSITHASYNAAAAGATTLYAADTGRDTLVRIGSIGGTPDSPNTGLITTIGSLGINANELGGMDFSSFTSTMYASFMRQDTSVSTLYTLNLNTGVATAVGQIGSGLFIRAIAVVPAPGTLGLLGLCGLIAARRRR